MYAYPPPTPPPRNFATHPVCHIKDILFHCKISSPSFLEFALCISYLFHTKREILPCQQVLRCNDKPFLLRRSRHDRKKCIPGSYLLQWPRYSNSMTTSPPPLPASSRPSLPSNFPSSSVWASLSTVNPDVLSALFAP